MLSKLIVRGLLREGRSDSALAQYRGMLHQIFHKAEANDLVRKNPVRFAEKMRSRGAPQKKDAFTEEEVKLLMEKLPNDRIGWSIHLMLGTGMRTQELLALEPRHIAQDGSVIQIRQAVNMVKGTVTVGMPKSRDSFRDKFKAAIGEIKGVRILIPHCCQHTYVSQMQALGVDLATIQSIVGHADVDMTQHYLHVQKSIREDAIARFSKAFATEEVQEEHCIAL